MDNVIDCGCTNNLIPDKSTFNTLPILEKDESAMFITNKDGTQQQVHSGVTENCLPFYDCNKATYTIILQRALYRPSFNFILISVSLLVKQGNAVIFNAESLFFFKWMVFFRFKQSAKEPSLSALSNFTWHSRFLHISCETLKKTAYQAVKGKIFSALLATDNFTRCSEGLMQDIYN